MTGPRSGVDLCNLTPEGCKIENDESSARLIWEKTQPEALATIKATPP